MCVHPCMSVCVCVCVCVCALQCSLCEKKKGGESKYFKNKKYILQYVQLTKHSQCLT